MHYITHFTRLLPFLSSNLSYPVCLYSVCILLFLPALHSDRESVNMPRKGKKTKHTAAELAAKIAAHKPRGGGEAGREDRRPKANMRCNICKAEIHNLTILRGHFTAKHPDVTLNEDDYME